MIEPKTNPISHSMEILAPAGGWESLEAAVRCGADAVYLGGKSMNARRGAANFDDAQIIEAVSFCHVRGIKVYVTLNTVVFSQELGKLEKAVASVCVSGADGVIVQDLAVAEMIRSRAPSLPLHASTQMSAHNLDGVKALEQLGFTRVVLARELSRNEIEYIATGTSLELECFVHGALCMCVSGQCYLSAMLGGRSGNRGLCAQPCRLPFTASSNVNDHALSLKDLSLIEDVKALSEAGIRSLKIEGRLKRPEYVAAAVTACRNALNGETPDMDTLRAVFSRGGFTNGYFNGNTGDHMFGIRDREGVADASVLKSLARLYASERQSNPVDFHFTVKPGEAVILTAWDDNGNHAEAEGTPPQTAINAPTTPEKATVLIGKTGGTPYFSRNITCDIFDGLMVPASEVNALRREVLDKITAQRARINAHPFAEANNTEVKTDRKGSEPLIRVRLQKAGQFSRHIAEKADMLIIPAHELEKLDTDILTLYNDNIAIELPRIYFDPADELDNALDFAMQNGVNKAVAGNLGGVERAIRHGFTVHGDFGLNITNSTALGVLREKGVASCTLSFEINIAAAREIDGIPRGIIAYGYLPLMITRNKPKGTKDTSSRLIDRLGNAFPLVRKDGLSELYNTVPLYLGDKSHDTLGLDFITLYFTIESPDDCVRILDIYLEGSAFKGDMTRGLYYRKVL